MGPGEGRVEQALGAGRAGRTGAEARTRATGGDRQRQHGGDEQHGRAAPGPLACNILLMLRSSTGANVASRRCSGAQLYCWRCWSCLPVPRPLRYWSWPARTRQTSQRPVSQRAGAHACSRHDGADGHLATAGRRRAPGGHHGQAPREDRRLRARAAAAHRRHLARRVRALQLGLHASPDRRASPARHPPDRTDRGHRDPAPDRRRRGADRLAAAGPVHHADPQRPVVDHRPAARGRSAVEFAGDQLVWEYYPGQGIQLQVLGTFGRANGLYASGKAGYPALQQLLAEMIPLAAQRGNSLAWEYYFSFDGGTPPWTSAMSQATGAAGALTRLPGHQGPELPVGGAARRCPCSRPRPPPASRCRRRRARDTCSTRSRPGTSIINAFLQTLIGLETYAQVSGDPRAAQLFSAGNGEAMAELPSFDTGAWSLYQPGIEDDLSYHELVTGFLSELCTLTAAPVYCTTAQHFTADLTTPPALTQLTLRGRTKHPTRLRFRLSKTSHVGITVTQGTRTVLATSASFPYGTDTFLVPASRAPAATASCSPRPIRRATPSGSPGSSRSAAEPRAPPQPGHGRQRERAPLRVSVHRLARCAREPSSIRARAGSARRRSPHARRAGAPPPECARS